MQRILVGVVGLAVILLAAAFGNFVLSALSDPADPGVNKAVVDGQSGEEPLVGLGVVPGTPDANAAGAPVQPPKPLASPPSGGGQ